METLSALLAIFFFWGGGGGRGGESIGHWGFPLQRARSVEF